jgi:hypothetical protein
MMGYDAIARTLRISPTRVRQIEQRALRKLRVRFAHMRADFDGKPVESENVSSPFTWQAPLPANRARIALARLTARG